MPNPHKRQANTTQSPGKHTELREAPGPTTQAPGQNHTSAREPRMELREAPGPTTQAPGQNHASARG
eukprot:2273673-Lingulodinium_polyedra.AAC.1